MTSVPDPLILGFGLDVLEIEILGFPAEMSHDSFLFPPPHQLSHISRKLAQEIWDSFLIAN